MISMGCYLVPTAAGLIHYLVFRKALPIEGSSRIYNRWLSKLFLGGAIFGVVDHWWNGELLLFGENLVLDLLLGVTITLVILVAWSLMILYDKVSSASGTVQSQKQ
ncbi:hypothetical protein GF351_01015 [Candidatus Woesearchaeota archaeon]|nr:hypothetical protein [Candidatus Woesearchaeota archaeon]